MGSEKISLIDESLAPLEKSSNPLLSMSQKEMEDYISISEKNMPGYRASFNHIRNQETKEIIVTGLVLHFSRNLLESKLDSLLGRRDIGHLYLYADTLVVSDRLEFP